MTLFKRIARWLYSKLGVYLLPERDALILHLVLHTAALELKKGEYRELAPLKGCTSPIRIYGNSLPVFEFLMFEKPIMEFVKVRVEVARPDRISFRATIESKGNEDNARHGEEIEVTARHKAVFEQLSRHLWDYFPLYPVREGGEVKREETA